MIPKCRKDVVEQITLIPNSNLIGTVSTNAVYKKGNIVFVHLIFQMSASTSGFDELFSGLPLPLSSFIVQTNKQFMISCTNGKIINNYSALEAGNWVGMSFSYICK